MKFCNGEFEAKRDTYGWTLSHFYSGKDKNGNLKKHKRDTFYGNIKQVFREILDRKAGECSEVSELIALLENAEGMIDEKSNS